MKRLGYITFTVVILLILTSGMVLGNTVYSGPLTQNETDQDVHWYLEGAGEQYRSSGGVDFNLGVDARLAEYFTVDTALTFCWESEKYIYKDGLSEFGHWLSWCFSSGLINWFKTGFQRILYQRKKKKQ